MNSAPELKVSLEGVSKSFAKPDGSRFQAVQDVRLDIRDGEFLSLVGPSGCGKTTLLNLIAGFERPDQGRVLFEGQPVERPGPERLVLFQEHGLFPWLNVQRNVEFGLRVRGVPRAERRERAIHYLQLVHLAKFRRYYPFQLSGGMRQRTAIARALAMEPRVLLMDEPFSALDPSTRDLLHLELQRLWVEHRRTIVLVTHSVEEAVRLSDRVVVMATQPGRVREIFEVALPHPRDFLDPAMEDLKARIHLHLDDELEKLMKKEGDDDWSLAKTSLGARLRGSLALDLGDGI